MTDVQDEPAVIDHRPPPGPKHQPKVSLIDYTGMGNPDPMYAARLLIYTKNTRLTQGEETRAKVAAMSDGDMAAELDYISNTIRSSWEFVSYTFEILGVTRAFTHQLVRTRHASFAQQAQRVVDMRGLQTLVPDTVMANDKAHGTWRLVQQMVGEAYGQMFDMGIPAQDCRGLLPTNVLTNIIMKIDLRNFVDLVGKRENLRAQGEYGEVARQMRELVIGIHPWTKPFISPDRKATPALDAILKRLLGDTSPVDQPEINAALKEVDKLKATWG